MSNCCLQHNLVTWMRKEVQLSFSVTLVRKLGRLGSEVLLDCATTPPAACSELSCTLF